LIDEIFGRETRAFSADAHLPSPSIVSAWGRAEPAIVDHMLNPLGHAWCLDRGRFDSDLRAGAARLGADVRSGANVRAARTAGGAWHIEVAESDGRARTLEGAVVIDASGRGARVAQQQGSRKRHLDR